MLETIGVSSMNDLLVDIPQTLRLESLQLPAGLSEFETMAQVAALAGLDVANASLYDGATAVAEAAMMAYVHTGRNEVLVSGYVHPEYVQVLRAFGEGRGIKVRKGGEPNKKTAAVIFQQPDFLGLLVEDRKSTRLNSSHVAISYAVFCLKKNSRC